MYSVRTVGDTENETSSGERLKRVWRFDQGPYLYPGWVKNYKIQRAPSRASLRGFS